MGRPPELIGTRDGNSCITEQQWAAVRLRRYCLCLARVLVPLLLMMMLLLLMFLMFLMLLMLLMFLMLMQVPRAQTWSFRCRAEQLLKLLPEHPPEHPEQVLLLKLFTDLTTPQATMAKKSMPTR